MVVSDDVVAPGNATAQRVSRSVMMDRTESGGWPEHHCRRPPWPNKQGKGGIGTAPNGTIPSTGRRRRQAGKEFAVGGTIRMEVPLPLA